MGIETINNYMREEIIKLYEEASLLYKDNKKSANYIPPYIKRRIQTDTTTQQIYDIIFNVTDIEKQCPVCNVNPKKFQGFGIGYASACCHKCAHNHSDYKNKLSAKLKGHKSKLKGKTYKEIYGDKKVKCGFQRGDKNIAKQAEIRKKISDGVKASYTPELKQLRSEQAYKTNFIHNHYNKNKPDKLGNLYRSKLEVLFANLLIDNDIKFDYEKAIPLCNGKIKIVDFIIDDFIYIEVSGYAYKNWQMDFIEKINLLKQSINEENIIYLLTYDKNVEKLFFDVSGKKVGDNIFIGSIFDQDRILKSINFIRNMRKINKEINKHVSIK
jgi:hypothetical protein